MVSMLKRIEGFRGRGGLIPLDQRVLSASVSCRAARSHVVPRAGASSPASRRVEDPNVRCATARLRASSLEADAISNEEESPLKEVARQHVVPGDGFAYETVPEMWKANAEAFGDLPAVLDCKRGPVVQMNYRELENEITCFAAGLQCVGLKQGHKVSLLSENSGRWIVADQGIMMNGAVDAVRGSSAPPEELLHIIRDSESTGIVVQDAESLKPLLPHLISKTENGNGGRNINAAEDFALKLNFIVILWGTLVGIDLSGFEGSVLTYEEVVQQGKELNAIQPFKMVRCHPSDLATLVYTSGTTGFPKGVMLTHGNLMSQVVNFPFFVDVPAGSRVLSLLPPWHIYERAVSYFVFSRGVIQAYSSVPTLKKDLQEHQPHFFVVVPLVLDTLYSRVMSELRRASAVRRLVAFSLLALSVAFIHAQRIVQGVAVEYARRARPKLVFLAAVVVSAILRPFHLLAELLVHRKIREAVGVKKVIVSGGASLAANLDDFYEAIGLPVLHGWGLTECSPVLTCRRATKLQNVRATIGVPMPCTELRVVDPDTLQDVGDGTPGLLLAKGPGVMKGYYRNEEATVKSFVGDWLVTGDCGWRAPEGMEGSQMGGAFVITGRLKDTIVLSSGENIEPQPIEDWLSASPLIKQIMLVGQDHRSVGALVVPDDEALEQKTAQNGTSLAAYQIHDAIFEDIRLRERRRPDFMPKDRIAAIKILKQPFSYEDGTLTRTMKLKRDKILESHKNEADELLHRLR